MRGQSHALVARPSRSRELEALPRSIVDNLSRRSAHALFRRLSLGVVTVVEGDERFVFGNAGALSTTITIKDPAAYRAMVLGGSVGVGEAFMRGHWTCDDLPALTRIFAQNLEALGAMDSGPARALRLAGDLVTRLASRNTRAGSRRNIARHYDLSNELFELFLDPSMMYSSAIFESEGATLEEAQVAKLDRVCRKLDLHPGDHLLEIGTGWGALAIHAAREYGCRVTTTTVSAEQHRLATERVRAFGLGDQIEVLLRDYRDLDGQYDKLVSIEMIEAVGEENWPQFFQTVAERLRPGGLGVIQAITIREDAFAQYRRNPDFIQRYIFPGGMLPTVELMRQRAGEAGLGFETIERFGASYAATLAEWSRRFEAAWPAIEALGFDARFRRMWRYYLAYCEIGFERGLIDVGLYRLRKPV